MPYAHIQFFSVALRQFKESSVYFFRRPLWLLCVLFCSLSLISQALQARPKIGLALGGGGAKGSAHIGVLKVLEQHKIPVDYIAGTSIGSVVGGLYAMGFSAQSIEKIMLETDWDAGYSDSIPRQALPWRVKQQTDQFNIALAVGIHDGTIRMPSGVLNGQTMSELLREAVGIQPDFTSFDELAVPYRAIATDLASYKAVVLDSGSLIAAMQASSTVPGALAPAYLNDLLLIDGGLTKNIPVDIVREMGADIVIAVDIGSDLLKREDLKDTFAVLSQLSAFLTNTNSHAQKDLLNQHDILIRPDIEGLSTTDWGVLSEALKRGTEAANLHLNDLIVFSLDDKDYMQYQQQRKQRHADILARADKPIQRIELNKKTTLHKNLILEKLNLNIKEPIDEKILNRAISQLYAIDEFQRVDARTYLEGDNAVLAVTPYKKSWGPNYLNLGVGWEDDFSSHSDLNLDIAFTLRELTHNGGEWRNELTLGARRAFSSEFYLPLESRRRFYSSSRLNHQAFEWGLLVEDNLLINIEQQAYTLRQGLGFNYTQAGFAEVGLTTEIGHLSNRFFLGDNVKYTARGGYMAFGFDDLDSISFPTQGTYLSIEGYWREEDVDAHPVVERAPGANKISSVFLDANWKTAFNLGHHTVVVKASYAEAFTPKNNESVYLAHLGGFLNLSGYSRDTLTGSKKAFAASMYQYDLGRSLLGLNQLPLYLGVSLEAGNVWRHTETIHGGDFIIAGSAYLGSNTKFGPIALGFGRTNTGEQSLYFYLGKNF